MELVKPGYKQTEVGVIPEDWEVIKLGKRGNFKNGINKPKKDFGHGDPFVNLLDVFGKPTIDSNKHLGLLNTSSLDRSVYNLIKGDVLFIRSSVKPSGVGLTSIVTKNLNRTVYSGFLIRYRPQGFHPLFLKYCFNEINFRSRLIATATSSANTNINQHALASLQIAVPPPLPEQRAIATALGDVDALLSALDRLIAKKEALKQGAMHVLLSGEKRLDGFSGDWEVRKLGEVLTEIPKYGINAAAVKFSPSLPRYLRITDINEHGKYNSNNSASLISDDADQFLLDKGEIVIARTGASVGKTYLYNSKDAPLVYAGFLIKIKPELSKANPAFLYYQLRTKRYWDWITEVSMRSGQPGINAQQIASYLVPIPSLPEQTAIATILSDMDGELDALRARRAKVAAIKKGMMGELLTGRVRLV